MFAYSMSAVCFHLALTSAHMHRAAVSANTCLTSTNEV